jgi:putative FmdB family regulatory protein
MPTYEFRCRVCDTVFEERRPMSESAATAPCPDGHADTVRLISLFASSRGAAMAASVGDRGATGGGGCCGGACGCGARSN